MVRSQSLSYVLDIDYYIIMFNRLTLYFGIAGLIGLIYIIHILININSINNVKESMYINHKPLILFSSGFIGLQLFYMIIFPQSGFLHIYLTNLFILIPAASAVGILFANADQRKSMSIIIILGLIMSQNLINIDDDVTNNHPGYLELQEWIQYEYEDDGSALVSSDINNNHLISHMLGPEILVRPVFDEENISLVWLENNLFSTLIITKPALETWAIIPSLSTDNNWCNVENSIGFEIDHGARTTWDEVLIFIKC